MIIALYTPIGQKQLRIVFFLDQENLNLKISALLNFLVLILCCLSILKEGTTAGYLAFPVAI